MAYDSDLQHMETLSLVGDESGTREQSARKVTSTEVAVDVGDESDVRFLSAPSVKASAVAADVSQQTAKVPNCITEQERRTALKAKRKAEREAAEQRRQMRGKAVCSEDNLARLRAKQKTSIASFFTSSRNPSNPGPLDCGSSRSASSIKTSVPVSIDTMILESHNPSESYIGSSKTVTMDSTTFDHELHLQLREDIVQISDGEGGSDSDDNLEEVPAPKKPKTNYDRTRRFQNEWAAKLVWAELVRDPTGTIHFVKCTVCSTFEKMPKNLGPKWDTLMKHEGRKKAAFDMPQYKVKAGEWYFSKKSRHQINLKLFAARQPASVLQQLNTESSISRSGKLVQFSTIYQILSAGRPMMEYEERQALYAFLHVPNLPRMHWSDSSGWQMADSLYFQVKEAIKKKLETAEFVTLTCDEVTTVDNGSWLAIHAYIVEDYSRIPFLISLQRLVEGATADSLTVLIMKALQSAGNVTSEQISKKLLCFGADGVNTFQGIRTGVATQIISKWAPFCMGMHCMAHRCNLAAKSLSALPIFAVVEQVIQKVHSYFSKSPKRLSEYQKLAEVMETKGLKPLRQVTTRWVSLLEPLRRLLSDYRTLVAKMKVDVTQNDVTEKCLTLLLDPYALLGMTALMPLLETIDLLVTFAQKRDVYICDFVAALKMAEGQFYTLYVDNATAYSGDEFWAFKNILDCSHNQIHTKWVSDLNSDSAQLVFVANGQNLWAMHGGSPVDREGFASLVTSIKTECSGAARQLLRELGSRFPSHEVMDALGVVYPQYWLQSEAEDSFPRHLDVLMSYYCEPKLIEVKKVKQLIPPILDRYKLESQQGLFKLAMINNSPKRMEAPFDLNPLTRLWRYLDSCIVLKVKAFPEFYKLAQIAIVQVLGSVEDERCFSSLAFLKNKLRNALDVHLECVVGMYSQKIFNLESFPYDDAYNQWLQGAEQRYGL